MSEMTRPEKPEKMEKEDEKEEEKHREKDEKSWDEKWRRDPLAAAGWAFLLIWAGIVLMAENLGFLAGLRPLEGWDLIFVGAGLIVLIGAGIRMAVPAYRRPIGGSVIFGVILLAIGLGDIGGPGTIWAVALILVGVFFLLRGFAGRK
jgi:hypothetical protein